MFLIIPPAYLSYFIPYTRLIVLWSPHWVASCSILFVSKHCSCEYLWRLWVACIINMGPSAIFIVIYFLCWISWPLRFLFFSCSYGCLPLFFPLASVVCVAAATLRFHISDCSSRIWSSWFINCVYMFPFIVVISVNAASDLYVSFGINNTHMDIACGRASQTMRLHGFVSRHISNKLT